MTALTKCKDCSALTLDTDDDARKHREWHRDYDQKFGNTRTAAVEARDALRGLRAEVKDLRDELDQQPAPIVPDEITVTDMRDDDELGLHDPDDQPSHYAADESGEIETAELDEGEPEDEFEPADGDEPDLAATQPLGRDPLREYFTGPTSIR